MGPVWLDVPGARGCTGSWPEPGNLTADKFEFKWPEGRNAIEKLNWQQYGRRIWTGSDGWHFSWTWERGFHPFRRTIRRPWVRQCRMACLDTNLPGTAQTATKKITNTSRYFTVATILKYKSYNHSYSHFQNYSFCYYINHYFGHKIFYYNV